MAEPDKIGKYEIQSVLGKGAMGVVYKGFDPSIERVVAIKTVRKEVVDPELAEQLMSRFKNEARAAGRLLHPNIVGVYEYGEDEVNAFIVMEYVEGTGLRDYLNRKAHFELGQIVSIISQLLSALDFAHARGVVHRDIKPANLILTAQGRLKVADFGIARIDTSNLTTIGSVMGTPSYMSPEQCQGKPLDGRSDLFSTAVVLYEMLTGEKPFGGSVESIAYKICHESPVPPSQRSYLGLPTSMDELVLQALNKDPVARFQSARAMGNALREAAGGDSIESSDATELNLSTVVMQPPLPPAWDESVLGTAERQLARFVGPVARVIVKKAAAQTNDLGELVSLLSDHIPTQIERSKFADGMQVANSTATGFRAERSGTHSTRERSLSQSLSLSRTRAPLGTPLEPAFIDQTTLKLAVYLGPIARVVARKASQQASNQQEFVARVAAHLGVQERQSFLREPAPRAPSNRLSSTPSPLNLLNPPSPPGAVHRPPPPPPPTEAPPHPPPRPPRPPPPKPKHLPSKRPPRRSLAPRHLSPPGRWRVQGPELCGRSPRIARTGTRRIDERAAPEPQAPPPVSPPARVPLTFPLRSHPTPRASKRKTPSLPPKKPVAKRLPPPPPPPTPPHPFHPSTTKTPPPHQNPPQKT